MRAVDGKDISYELFMAVQTTLVIGANFVFSSLKVRAEQKGMSQPQSVVDVVSLPCG